MAGRRARPPAEPSEPRAERLPVRAWVWWGAAIGGSLALFALSVFLFPTLPLDPRATESSALLGYAVAYAAVSACVLGAGAATPDLGRAAIAIVAIAALVLVGLSSSSPTPTHAAIVLACLLVAGVSAGVAVGARVESAGHLLPVAVVSSLADVVSVLTPGAPSDVVADTPALLSVLALPWPMPGTHDLPALLGVGDVVFVGLYFGASRRHALPLARTTLALALGLLVTALVVAATSVPIPALPFLGSAMIAAHPATRQLPPRDRRPAALGLAIVVLALVALVLLRRPG